MNNHPLNLGLRFLLEIALILVFAYWSWNRFDGILRYLLSIVIPAAGMIIWGVFRVDGDPGKALIAIPGWARLCIEAGLFITAFLMLRSLDLKKWSLLFIGITLIHYAASYDRIKWLLKN